MTDTTTIQDDDRLPKTQAMHEFGWDYAKIEKHIADHDIRSAPGTEQIEEKNGRDCLHHFVYVSRSDCNRMRERERRRKGATRQPKVSRELYDVIKRMGHTLPELQNTTLGDGIPLVNDKTKTHGMEWHAIVNQCGWDPHPLLGKRIGVGLCEKTVSRGKSTYQILGLEVSSKEIETITKLIAHPWGKKFGGNAGVWTDPGIYLDEHGKLWISAAYAKEQYDITHSSACIKSAARMEVVFPSGTMQADGKLTVYSDEDVQRYRRRKDGKELPDEKPVGEWRTKWKCWRSESGEDYYTAAWIRQQREKSTSPT